MNTTMESRRQIIFNRRPSGVAFLLLDCLSKLNYLGTPVMHELDRALEEVQNDPSIKALVMMSGKHDHFIIGADIFEIRKATTVAACLKLSKDGQNTLNNVAALQIPVLTAIHGACLGGGLELAMSSHYRIATDDASTQLGLPETRLGIIPGLGGTQRLPRIAGLKAALGMILSAEPVPAAEALTMGLVDELCSRDELMAVAEKRALELIADRSRIQGRMDEWAEPVRARNEATNGTGVKATKWCVRDLEPEKATKLFAMTERSIRIKTRGHYPAQTQVLDVIKEGLNNGINAGLELEAKTFSELASGDVAANLIALFFATDFAKQSAASLAAKFNETDTAKVGIVGGGMMGCSIAALSARHNIDIALKVKPGKETSTRETVCSHHFPKTSRSSSDGHENEANLMMEHLHCSADYGGLSDSQLVLETISEELDRKVTVLKEIEAHVSEDCTIASNTSSLPLAKLSEALQKNDRFLGLHFFHPVERMSLVEIVTLKTTSRKATARAADFVTKLGKIPVVVKDGPGFLINRLLTCYLLESARMIQDGVPLNWIEEAAVDFGMPIGPIEVLDEVGLELAVTIAETLHQAFGERMASPSILRGVPELGLVGKKSGKGMYLWDENGRRKEFNPDLSRLPELVISPEKASPETKIELAQRLIYPMIDEAARCLEDRIVMKPREIDMAIIHGIGFPPFRGGLLKYADKVGLKEVVARLNEVYSSPHHAARSVAPLLQKYVAEGRNFYSRGGKEEE